MSNARWILYIAKIDDIWYRMINNSYFTIKKLRFSFKSEHNTQIENSSAGTELSAAD